ncbi:MAG TPA: hypothetical protein VHH92_03485 [Actinomycetota bacterium]|nr:hypothetical protein [Actinomycetota bacterium]
MADDEHEREPHLDDQTAQANPRGPGREKTENLRRIERQLEEQRRRVGEAAEPADDREDDAPLP